MSRPRTSACTSSLSWNAEPTSSLISSAVCWPIRSLYSFLMWLVIASSISSPPTLRLCETTMPPREMTATSVVPPPTSTIMFPVGSETGRPAPIAAAIGSSIRWASRAPAESVASSTARFSTPVTPDGTQTTTLGCAKRCWWTFWMKWRSICSVTSKSAMTPSLSGRIARDRAGRAAEHALRLDADGVDFARALVDRDDRRLREDDAAPTHVDERVCGAQVHGHVAAAEAIEVPQEAHRPAPECSDSVENREGQAQHHHAQCQTPDMSANRDNFRNDSRAPALRSSVVVRTLGSCPARHESRSPAASTT